MSDKPLPRAVRIYPGPPTELPGSEPPFNYSRLCKDCVWSDFQPGRGVSGAEFAKCKRTLVLSPVDGVSLISPLDNKLSFCVSKRLSKFDACGPEGREWTAITPPPVSA